MEVVNFREAYKLHQPREVRAMMDEPDQAKRTALAFDLARRGFQIDEYIMVMGNDPFKTMELRLLYGMPWEPPVGAPPIVLSPGPGQSITDFSIRPRGAMVNSLDPADFPPADPPPPVVPIAAASSYVGAGPNRFGTFVSMNGDPLNELGDAAIGKRVKDPRGTFVYGRTPFGGFYELAK